MREAGVPPRPATTSLPLADVFPPTARVGRCRGCAEFVLAHQPHEWADRVSRELCWPHEHEAVLYCGACSDAQHSNGAR
jgi:hypothetical protein